MKKTMIRILIVDDDAAAHRVVGDMLGSIQGKIYYVNSRSDYTDAFLTLCQNEFDVCLIGDRAGGRNSLDMIQAAAQIECPTPLILLTASENPEAASDALKAGADDFLIKNKITPDLLDRAIHYTIERRRNLQKLKLTQLSVDRAGDMVFWIDPNARFVYVNDATCRTMGYSRDELLNMTVHDIAPDYQPERWAQHWCELKQQGSIHLETLLQTRGGEKIPVDIQTNYIKYAGREYNFAFARDISEYKQTQQRLSQAMTRFEAVLKNVPMVAIQSLEPNGTIRYWNTYSEYFYGLTAQEVVGHRFQDILLEGSETQKFEDMLRTIRQTRRPTSPREMQVHTLAHSNRWVYSVEFPIFEGDQIFEIFSVSVDITELKHAQTEMLQAREETEHVNRQLEASITQANFLTQQARAANEAKSLFLANMSHEIRTPLHAIIGFSDILVQDAITDEQKKFVQLIQTAGHSLLDLINDILDFSKIEAGKLELEITPCSLETILNDIHAMMKPAAQKKNLTFEILPDPDVPLIIHTDPTRLRQCLINLINNAVKFTESGCVRTRISNKSVQSETFIRFDVEDTGIGISAEAQKKIFDLFVQADDGITRKYGGTGLGLAITRNIAKNLGGSVAVRSEPDRGSTFTLTIPAGVVLKDQPTFQSRNYRPEATARPLQCDIYHGRVLVAEDNPSNQILMNKLLQKIGLEVVMAIDGRDAVEKASTGNFDLIFMDMQMPRMNGFQATEKLRQEKITAPIIALTASAMKGDREKCLLVGCNDYLAKPINRDELRKIMEKYLPDAKSTEVNPRETEIHPAPNPVDSDDQPLISELAQDPDLCEVANMFVKELPDSINKILDAARQKDYDQLKFLVHTLKGASGSAGFPALMKKTIDVEQLILHQQADFLPTALDELNRLCRRVHAVTENSRNTNP
jgi:PAS domain S-box-containing protein